MTSFSERHSFTQPKKIQIDNLDMELRNSLWNVCSGVFFIQRKNKKLSADPMYHLATKLYRDYYKRPIESLTDYIPSFVEQQLDFFQTAQWYDVLNIVEFMNTQCLRADGQQTFEHQLNEVLEREKSAYRFIAGKLAPITNETEMRELELAARCGDRFAPVAEHVRTALEFYCKKPRPDYRNSIKESISAVESAAKVIAGLKNATLGDAIKVIDQRHSLHKSFKEEYCGYMATQAMKVEFDTACRLRLQTSTKRMLVTCL
jgi:hypothetical protein